MSSLNQSQLDQLFEVARQHKPIRSMTDVRERFYRESAGTTPKKGGEASSLINLKILLMISGISTTLLLGFFLFQPTAKQATTGIVYPDPVPLETKAVLLADSAKDIAGTTKELPEQTTQTKQTNYEEQGSDTIRRESFFFQSALETTQVDITEPIQDLQVSDLTNVVLEASDKAAEELTRTEFVITENTTAEDIALMEKKAVQQGIELRINKVKRYRGLLKKFKLVMDAGDHRTFEAKHLHSQNHQFSYQFGWESDADGKFVRFFSVNCKRTPKKEVVNDKVFKK